jgi:hypothetical protein
LKGLLLFPEVPDDSGAGFRFQLRNTFLDVVEDDNVSQPRSGSEPKSFKPGSSSESDISNWAEDVPSKTDVKAQYLADPIADDVDDDLPSDTNIAEETFVKPSVGSCVDRSCLVTCPWYWQGDCFAGELCKSCHYCTEEDAARARKKHSLRTQRTKTQASPSSAAAAVILGEGLLSQGSCYDAVCGRACAWYSAQRGCRKGSACFFCHACPPQAHTAAQRERLENLQAIRALHKDRKKRRQKHSADAQPFPGADGQAESHRRSKVTL